GEHQPVVPAGQSFGMRHALADRRGKALALADEADLHAAPVELVHLALERVHEQLHQRADLVLWPAPVLAGEGEQRQRRDAALEAEVDAGVDRPRTGTVAHRTWPAAALGPTPVAVHDDGEVRSEEHTSELQSRENLVCRRLLEKKKTAEDVYRCR